VKSPLEVDLLMRSVKSHSVQGVKELKEREREGKKEKKERKL
jgi:hypothetical protein